MTNRTRGTAQKVVVFRLPVPVVTDAVGIFPQKWSNKPYLALDLMACYVLAKGKMTHVVWVLLSILLLAGPEGKSGVSDVSPCLESQGWHLIPSFCLLLLFCLVLLLLLSSPFSAFGRCPEGRPGDF